MTNITNVTWIRLILVLIGFILAIVAESRVLRKDDNDEMSKIYSLGFISLILLFISSILSCSVQIYYSYYI